MNIYLPYTKILDPTLFCLGHYEFIPVKLKGDFGYYEYFRQRWLDQKKFINIEQDIIFHPGALEELWDCPNDWCAFGYNRYDNVSSLAADVYLGLVKFSERFIRATDKMWSEVENPVWQRLDHLITHYARSQMINVHTHEPAVVNYHPEATRGNYNKM